MENLTRLTDSLTSYNFFVTGTTGSGKSVFLRFMIKHLCSKYKDIEILVVDLKATEFTCPSLGFKVVTDIENALPEIERFCGLATDKKRVVIIDECYELLADKGEKLLSVIIDGQRRGIDFMIAAQNNTIVPAEIKERLPYKAVFKGAIPEYDGFEIGEAVIITDEGSVKARIPYVSDEEQFI